MIKYIKAILIGLISISAIGQGIDLEQDSVLYLTEEEEAFMLDKETGYLLKIFPIGFEVKLGKSLSVFAEPVRHLGADNDFSFKGYGIGFGMRYFYQMANRIVTGKQANNLSGKYIGIKGSLSNVMEKEKIRRLRNLFLFKVRLKDIPLI